MEALADPDRRAFRQDFEIDRNRRIAETPPLIRIHRGLVFALLAVSRVLSAQLPSGDAAVSPYSFSESPLLAAFSSGSGGGGQVEPAAFADRYLTRLSVSGDTSTLGTGVGLATNLPYRIDLRAFGNITSFDWKLNQSGFYIIVGIRMANTGVKADFYPWKSFRLSPGFLFYNTNHVDASLQAQTGATFTLNNITYISDNANPVNGVGGITLGGRGFMATTGWGHYVSRNEKHWHFPFEAGAAFIGKPAINFALQGEVCQFQGYNCVPASSFPGFQTNLNEQLASWNKRVAPFHVYPIIQGGMTYTFRYRR